MVTYNRGELMDEGSSLKARYAQFFQGRVFRGSYRERCYANKLRQYRAVVKLHRDEVSLSKMLRGARVAAETQMPKAWIGIRDYAGDDSDNEENTLEMALWVSGLDELAFGEYLFCISDLVTSSSEVTLKVRVLSPIDDIDDEASSLFSTNSTRSILNSSKSDKKEADISMQDFLSIMPMWAASFKRHLYNFLVNGISLENTTKLLRIATLAFVVLVAGCIGILKELCHFALRLSFELSRFVHVCTPIVFRLIDAMLKIIGGIFVFLAMIWRDMVGVRRPPPPPAQRMRIPYAIQSGSSIKRLY